MKDWKKMFFAALLLVGGSSFAQTYVLDPTFSGDGSMTGAAASGPVQIFFHQEKYLTIGSEKIAQVNYDGTVNTAFGTNGYVEYYTSWGSGLTIKGAKISGNYLVAYGKINNEILSETDDFFISRIDLATGQPDPGFGNNGVTVIDFGEEEATTDVHLFADGTILLAGTKQNDTDYSVILSRLAADGGIDYSFAASGYKTMVNQGFGGQLFPTDGEILLTAAVRHEPMSGNWDYLLLKMTAEGNLIGSFGDNGIKRIPLPFTFAYSVTPQMGQIKDNYLYASYAHGSNGYRIMKCDLATQGVIYDTPISNIGNFSISAGQQIYYTEYSSIPSYNFTLKRLDSDGEPDSTFNGSGQYTYTLLPFPPAETLALSSFVHENGRIVVGGWSRYPTGNYNLAMIRIADPATLGVDSISNVPFAILPNPVANRLYLHNPGQRSIEQLEVFDLGGKKLLTAPNQSQLEVENLPAGMYLLWVTASGNKFCIKFLKS